MLGPAPDSKHMYPIQAHVPYQNVRILVNIHTLSPPINRTYPIKTYMSGVRGCMFIEGLRVDLEEA